MHNPNLPINRQDVEDYEPEIDLHLQAGLVDAGIDNDGEMEWIGTDEKWKRYNKLVEEYENS